MYRKIFLILLVILLFVGLALLYFLFFSAPKKQRAEPQSNINMEDNMNAVSEEATAAVLIEQESEISNNEAKAALDIAEGSVQYTTASQPWQYAIDGQALYEQDCLKTMSESSAAVIFEGNHIIRLDENTEICLLDVNLYDNDRDSISIKQIIGNTWSRVESLLDKEVEYEVESDTIVATVRGTAFNFMIDKEKNSYIDVAESKVEVAAFELADGERKKISGLELLPGKRIELNKTRLEQIKKRRLQIQEEDTPVSFIEAKWFKANIVKDGLVKELLRENKDRRELLKKRLELRAEPDLRELLNSDRIIMDPIIQKRVELFLINNDLDEEPQYKDLLRQMETSNQDPESFKMFLRENIDDYQILIREENIDR